MMQCQLGAWDIKILLVDGFRIEVFLLAQIPFFVELVEPWMNIFVSSMASDTLKVCLFSLCVPLRAESQRDNSGTCQKLPVTVRNEEYIPRTTRLLQYAIESLDL